MVDRFQEARFRNKALQFDMGVERLKAMLETFTAANFQSENPYNMGVVNGIIMAKGILEQKSIEKLELYTWEQETKEGETKCEEQ